MIKLSKALRLGGTELNIENVTEREAKARNLPLTSAWIVSLPKHESVFPLIIFTAPQGVLNKSEYDELRKTLKEKPLKKGQFGYGIGSFEVSKIGECLVVPEQVIIASQDPPRFYPTNESGLSIIGTVNILKIDFQIMILSPKEDLIVDLPEYKSMLYGPDHPVAKDLAFELIEAISNSNILPVKVTDSKKYDRDENEVKSRIEVVISNPLNWMLIMAIAGLGVIIFYRLMKRSPKRKALQHK